MSNTFKDGKILSSDVFYWFSGTLESQQRSNQIFKEIYWYYNFSLVLIALSVGEEGYCRVRQEGGTTTDVHIGFKR